MNITRALLLAAAIAVCLYIAISLFGNPIQKHSVSQELLQHLEGKYDESFTLVEATYSWKSGTYGGIYQSEKNTNIQFAAEKYRTGHISDYYPEETWLYEMEQALIPTAKEIFAGYEQVTASTVWGIGEDEVTDGKIPAFNNITNRDTLQIVIRKKAAYPEMNQEEVQQQIFTLVQFLKQHTNTVGLMLAFDNPEQAADEEDGFYNIAGEDIEGIDDVEDVRRFLIGL